MANNIVLVGMPAPEPREGAPLRLGVAQGEADSVDEADVSPLAGVDRAPPELEGGERLGLDAEPAAGEAPERGLLRPLVRLGVAEGHCQVRYLDHVVPQPR